MKKPLPGSYPRKRLMGTEQLFPKKMHTFTFSSKIIIANWQNLSIHEEEKL